MAGITDEVKTKLLDIHNDSDFGKLDQTWCQGYISALADYDIVNEGEFDALADWILTN